MSKNEKRNLCYRNLKIKIKTKRKWKKLIKYYQHIIFKDTWRLQYNTSMSSNKLKLGYFMALKTISVKIWISYVHFTFTSEENSIIVAIKFPLVSPCSEPCQSYNWSPNRGFRFKIEIRARTTFSDFLSRINGSGYLKASLQAGTQRFDKSEFFLQHV